MRRHVTCGVGIYAADRFFALIDDDVLYFKVDTQTRPTYEAAGMTPFQPYGPGGETMGYYRIPIDVLEDVDVLRSWVADAIAVAERAPQKKRVRRRAR
jgi:DNA transformation protein and related proteins